MIGTLLFASTLITGPTGIRWRDAPESVPHIAFASQTADANRPKNAARTNAAVDNVQAAAIYRLSGEKSLRPVRIGDDGTHIYLEWSDEQALPAVFALNAIGEEEMVDGYMRAGIFTIDRVHQALVFRIGKKRAFARRTSK